jgi:hypothetical protein
MSTARLLLILVSVAPAVATPAEVDRTWAILPPAETARAVRPCSRSRPDDLSGNWTPTDGDITAAETVVEGRMSAAVAALRADLRPKPPFTYYRQYVGTFLAGKRVLYVTGLSKAMVDRRPRIFRWRSKAFTGCDFGPQVFGAVFDTTSRRFISFDFDY